VEILTNITRWPQETVYETSSPIVAITMDGALITLTTTRESCDVYDTWHFGLN